MTHIHTRVTHHTCYTLPPCNLSGSGFWDTPMTRTLYKVPHMAPGGLIARPASPEDSEGDMYLTLMRLPLVEPFRCGEKRCCVL
jgi:hypothetical protein